LAFVFPRPVIARPAPAALIFMILFYAYGTIAGLSALVFSPIIVHPDWEDDKSHEINYNYGRSIVGRWVFKDNGSTSSTSDYNKSETDKDFSDIEDELDDDNSYWLETEEEEKDTKKTVKEEPAEEKEEDQNDFYD